MQYDQTWSLLSQLKSPVETFPTSCLNPTFREEQTRHAFEDRTCWLNKGCMGPHLPQPGTIPTKQLVFSPLAPDLRVVWAPGGGGGKKIGRKRTSFCLDKRTFHRGGLKRPACRKDDQIHKHKDLIHTQKPLRSEWELVRP